jgi:hypothetical protein
MTARRLPFPVPRSSWKPRSVKCSRGSRASTLATKDALLQQWEQHHQRMQAILILRPDVARPIVDGLGKVLDLIGG